MVSRFEAGAFIERYGYKSFRPKRINRQFKLEDDDANTLLSKANLLLGELNAYSELVPDVDFFIKMHIFKEAAESSRIEGTKTEFDEVFLKEGNISPGKRDDWQEVQNYVKAMNYAIEGLARVPISMRLIKETHQILLQDVRGGKKCPGEIRNSQNWIGGSDLQNAFFVPPHKDELPELLSDMEKFWHNEKLKIPDLVKAAISHYQFETIHPFLDGNGRMGRLLITLYLIDKNVLSKPVLYLSDFFSRNKGSYYDSLTLVRHSNDLKGWILFFMAGVVETAENSKNAFKKIIELRRECEEKLLTLVSRSKRDKAFLAYLYSQPVVDVNEVAGHLGVTHQSANSLVKRFVELGILKELTNFKRNRIFSFYSYLGIFR